LKMIRTRLTWIVVGGILALAVVGAVDALFSSGSSGTAPETGTALQPQSADAVSVPAESRAAPLPRCTSEQIAASIDVLGGSATVAVRHARGRACHLASLPVHLRVWDRAGEPLRLPTTEGAEIPSRVGGDFSRGFERLINITYFPPWNCDERGPFLAVVKVGPYVARRPLSRDEIGCFTGG
jgi:hypothetical protein